MADVIKKNIPANDYSNGSVIVSINIFGTITNHKIAPENNQITQIPEQSGLLDTRFDDVGYYMGGSG